MGVQTSTPGPPASRWGPLPPRLPPLRRPQAPPPAPRGGTRAPRPPPPGATAPRRPPRPTFIAATAGCQRRHRACAARPRRHGYRGDGTGWGRAETGPGPGPDREELCVRLQPPEGASSQRSGLRAGRDRPRRRPRSGAALREVAAPGEGTGSSRRKRRGFWTAGMQNGL